MSIAVLQREVEGREYFPAIDGLRALAVVAVMVYHLVPSVLPGGFVGVDMFFVISGFVVTGSMIRDAALPFPQFLATFYARRFRRIVPALVVCLVVTVLVSVAFIPRAWLSDALRSTGLHAFFGLSNFALVATNDGYFAPRTEFNPFTHTWSLAVEEQFYLVFPIVLYACVFRVAAAGRTAGLAALWALNAASLLWCTHTSASAPDSAYYLLPSRFWELGLGSMACLASRNASAQLMHRFGTVITVAGAGLVILAAADTQASAFPFPWALVVVLGTLFLILAARSGAPASTATARLMAVLGSRAFVSVGLVSYSLYLWHWPVYTLLRWTLGLESVPMYATALGLTGVLAVASYLLVELPSQRHAVVRRLPNWATVCAGLAVVTLGWSLSHAVYARPSYFALSVVSRNAEDWYPQGFGSHDGIRCKVKMVSVVATTGTRFSPVDCQGVLQYSGRRLFVAGDSHAGARDRMLSQLVARTGIEVVRHRKGGCPIGAASLLTGMDDASCQRFKTDVVAEILREGKPGDLVLLVSLRVPRLVDQDGPALVSFPAPAAQARAEAEAQELALRLTAAGLQVIFELPTPVFRSPPFRCSDAFNHMNPACSEGLDIERDFVERHRALAVTAINRIAAANPGVHVWDPLPSLCGPRVCSAVADGRPLFFDADHLSGYGNERLVPSFIAMLESGLPPNPTPAPALRRPS